MPVSAVVVEDQMQVEILGAVEEVESREQGSRAVALVIVLEREPEATNQLGRTVGAAVADDYDLQPIAGVSLLCQLCERLLERRPTRERWNYDAESRRVPCKIVKSPASSARPADR
jgi:hypothetical protein